MSSKNIFGKRIFELRKSAGMTQKQLGESVGLSMQAINDIEKGRRETTITKAILIAKLFNTTVEYLCGSTDDQTRPVEEFSDVPFTFAERLKELQYDRKVTWEEIADVLESASQNNSSNMNVIPLIALADYFNVSLDYLVGRSDNPERR